MPFQHEFAAWYCIFEVIKLVQANQRNNFENVTPCSKRILNGMWQFGFNFQDKVNGHEAFK